MRHIALSQHRDHSLQIDLADVPNQVDENVLIKLFRVLAKELIRSPLLVLLDHALSDHLLRPTRMRTKHSHQSLSWRIVYPLDKPLFQDLCQFHIFEHLSFSKGMHELSDVHRSQVINVCLIAISHR